MEERERRIRDEAYRIWVAAGRPEGREQEHWLEAEKAVSASEKQEPKADRKPGKPSGAGKPKRKEASAAGAVAADAGSAKLAGKTAGKTVGKTAGKTDKKAPGALDRARKAKAAEGAAAAPAPVAAAAKPKPVKAEKSAKDGKDPKPAKPAKPAAKKSARKG